MSEVLNTANVQRAAVNAISNFKKLILGHFLLLYL